MAQFPYPVINNKIPSKIRNYEKFRDEGFPDLKERNKIKITVKDKQIYEPKAVSGNKVLNKLEETYWATWKPNKAERNYNRFPVEQHIKNQFVQANISETSNTIEFKESFESFNEPSTDTISREETKIEQINKHDAFLSNCEIEQSVIELFENTMNLSTIPSDDSNAANSMSQISSTSDNKEEVAQDIKENSAETVNEKVEVTIVHHDAGKTKKSTLKERLELARRRNTQKSLLPTPTAFRTSIPGSVPIRPSKNTARNSFTLGPPGSSLLVTRKK